MILYKRSYARPLLRCVTPEMRQKVLDEIHEQFAAHILASVRLRSLLSELAIIGTLYTKVL